MKYQVSPLFSVPLYQTNLGPIDPITRAWLLNLEYPSYRTGYDGTDADLDDTSKGMYILDKSPLKRLRAQIKAHVDNFAHEALGIDDHIEFEFTTSWANRNTRDDYITIHGHSNSMISGVYYIEVSSQTAPIIFEQSIASVNLFHRMVKPTFKDTHRNQYNLDSYTIQPTNGDLYIFPSHLEHAVPRQASDQYRYSLAFNCFARGSMGTGTGQVTL